MTAAPHLIVETARDWIGTPYRHQASVKGAGTDCLGLIRGVWREILGEEPEAVPAYTQDWSEARGEERLWLAARSHFEPAETETVEAGQILLFRVKSTGVAKHLGIAAGTGPDLSFIHAYSGHSVLESPLTLPWQRRIVARFNFPERVR